MLMTRFSYAGFINLHALSISDNLSRMKKGERDHGLDTLLIPQKGRAGKSAENRITSTVFERSDPIIIKIQKRF